MEPFTFSQKSINELKEKYLKEMKDADDNPIKICMSLIFEAATQKDSAKRNEVSMKLSEFLIKSDGLVNLFLALIDFDTSSQQVTTHNQRFMAVANIITCLPKLCVPYTEYCDSISRQLKPLLIHPINQYSSLASMIIKALVESPHAQKSRSGPKIASVVLGPILKPLSIESSKPNELSASDAIIVIHNLVQNHLSVKLLVCVFPNLLHCLLTLHPTSSHLKSYLGHTLIKILNDLKPGPACCLLEQTILDDSNKYSIYKMKANDNEISIELSSPAEFDTCDLDELVIDLLDSCDNDHLTLEFFFHFQAKMWSSTTQKTGARCAALIEPLLTRTMEDKPDSKPDLMTSMATNSRRSFDLITKTLINYLDFIQNHRKIENGESTQNVANSSLVSCINILEVLCSATSREDESTIHDKIVPVMSVIKSTLSFEKSVVNDKLLQSIDSFLSRFERSPSSNSSSIGDNYSVQKEHDDIIKDLNDELVPVRVHALVRLKQLVMTNDKLTVMKIPQLYSLVESTLADRESYVFLASINLLAEMGIRRTDDILPKLIALYSRQDLSTEQRINVGEVLARVTRRMNETTPHYARQIMDILLQSTDDQDELVRISSLTNIGLICSNLNDSLGRYILDILVCVERILSVDTIQVKCGALDLLRTTLMGLNRINVESVQRELKSIYKLIKKLKISTLDEKLCLQVTLALDEIDRLAKDMLGCVDERQEGDTLVKNIKVLSLLD